ncbi:ABC transporter ATP-binding protein [Dyadobacter frigoris]|uniref:ABC transporter ATP-binding protein n=1 Tax=Dyadobacter frigoris TaxID=2576211 RepID=A0A4U6D7R7_9BACT|nr:ABC transporter ATP-binding protein [Dyadobacter frigoris]TKT92341.1 ABC transporter ATP-binding protein [Dyadobacter frigoris]GLU53529.1 ABC transporter ATP-binding protein [Dyadobacter frigoris]
MLQLKSVSHTYNGKEVLNFSDWDIRRGENWLLLGESGSGKTTLLHILTGIKKPTKGQVMINETDLYKLSSRQMDRFRGRNIGLVFQQPHLIKSLTVEENLKLAQTFAKLPEDKVRIEEVLSELGIIQKIKSYPSELSQGQLQRASIARAVLNKPTLLIADEPTSSLDNKNAKAVINLLLKLSESSNSTLIISTHDDRVKESFSKEYLL